MKLLLVLFSEHINHPFEIVSQSVFCGAKEMESAKRMGKSPTIIWPNKDRLNTKIKAKKKSYRAKGTNAV